MSRFTNRSLMQKVFVFFAVFGVILNVTFDYRAYIQQMSSDKTGKAVAETYEVLIRLQKLERSIERWSLAKDPAVEEATTVDLIEKTKNLELSPQQSLLLTGLKMDIQNRDFAAAGKKSNELISLELKILSEDLQVDSNQNQNIESSLFSALILDSMLVLLLVTFFLIELRARKRVELKLVNSLANFREANLALQEQQLKNQMSVKTTIHDLKNPLGSIQGFADLISEEEKAPAAVQEFSGLIKKISQDSIELVNSLLRENPVENIRQEPVDLISIIEEISVQTEVLATQKNQILRKDYAISKAWVLGDQLKLGEIVSNLLSNAIKYSPQNTEIWIRCLCRDTYFCVEIEDQGPGFTDDDKSKAFIYGQTLSAKPTGNETSTGFGLFMAKKIVELHKGHIRILKPNNGSRGARIVFELPLLNKPREQSLTT